MTGVLMSLADRLHAETEAHRARLEHLPGFQALSEGHLPPGSQRTLLQALFLLQQDLEQALASTSHPALAAAAGGDAPLSPRLAEELARLGPEEEFHEQVLLGAIAFGERMHAAARHEPFALLGHLYALRSPLTLRATGQQGLEREAFARRLDGVPLTEEEAARVAGAAREAFDRWRGLLDTLHPPRALVPVARLNPEAGTHAVTTDLVELRAAVRAAERSWEEFPYYPWRYGERGRRFSWSDSGWLALLAGESETMVWRQISWLGGLLAARGMPRLLLERHLEVLRGELTLARPERQAAYDSLRLAAERLAGERRRFLDDAALRTLEADFAARVGPEWSRRLRGSGELLGSAVADECCGLAEAVPSFLPWMTEPSRFPPAWRQAVEDTLTQARQLRTEHAPG